MVGSGVVLAVAVVVLASGCSSAEKTAPPPVATSATQNLPDPATAVLDPGKAAALQAVLAKVVASPTTEAGARGVTAAVVTDQWSWSGAAGTDAAGTKL